MAVVSLPTLNGRRGQLITILTATRHSSLPFTPRPTPRFTIASVPVGKELMDTLRVKMVAPPESVQPSGQGSIIVIVATDAPLLPHQLKRIAERVSIGVGMVGGRGENSSGDIFFAFSTADTGFSRNAVSKVEMLANDLMDPLFNATVNATQEAIINAMVSAKTLVGVNGNTAYALPKERVIKALKKYNRYKSPSGD